MKCYVTGHLDGTGKCNNEATQINACGKPVCDKCAEDSNNLASIINYLHAKIGEPPVYKLPIPQSDN